MWLLGQLPVPGRLWPLNHHEDVSALCFGTGALPELESKTVDHRRRREPAQVDLPYAGGARSPLATGMIALHNDRVGTTSLLARSLRDHR
jgi:hypothetical protein